MIKKLLWLAFYSLPLVAFAARRAEPLTEAIRLQPTENLSIPIKVIINKGHREQPPVFSGVPGNSAKLHVTIPAARAVKAFVEAQALRFGVNPTLAVWIVKHESSFNPRAKGDGEASRGLWQISKIYHPEVTDEVAFNMASSTEWSLGRIRAGKAYEWSTYHYCRTLYKDCPF